MVDMRYNILIFVVYVVKSESHFLQFTFYAKYSSAVYFAIGTDFVLVCWDWLWYITDTMPRTLVYSEESMDYVDIGH